MKYKKEYVVPIYNEPSKDDDILPEILKLTRGLDYLVDETGKLKDGCGFLQRRDDLFGDHYIFITDDKSIADKVRDKLMSDSNLRIRPVEKLSYKG